MENQKTVHINGRDLPISTKHSIEISNFIRHKPIGLAKKQLGLVLDKKLAIPARRFNKDRGHRKGKVGPGFYPQKASKEIIKLLTSLEGYAAHDGLDKNNLFIKEIIPNKASTSYHYGRIRGIQNKSTHIKIVAAEIKKKKVEEKPKEKVKQPEAKKPKAKIEKKEKPKEKKW